MEQKRFGVGLVIACVLALGLSPWAMADDPVEGSTECDGEIYGLLNPSIKDPDAALLMAVFPVSQIPLVGDERSRMDVRRTETEWCHYDMRVSLDHVFASPFDGASILVDTELGQLAVSLELGSRGPWPFEVVNYWKTGDDCELWNDRVDAFLSDPYRVKFGINGVWLTQVADVCITAHPECSIISPFVGQEGPAVDAYMPPYNPGVPYPAGWPLDIWPDDRGIPLGVIMTDHVTGMIRDFATPVFGTVWVDGDGQGTLIPPYHLQIQTDGCERPVWDQVKCLGGSACSVVAQPMNRTARSANTLFYLLPVAVMIGLILRRRRG